MSRYGLASEAYRVRSIALWRTYSFPRSAMRSAFRSPGVPSTKEAGMASLVGGASNRPMCAGSTDNSFLNTNAPLFSSLQYQLVGMVYRARNCGNYMKLVEHY